MKRREVDVTIESFSKKGEGIGTFVNDSEVKYVQVPFTQPGDEVRATLYKKKKGLYQARLETILSPSQHRIKERCKHFGVCGGCRWQHMDYSEQLRYKELIINKYFNHLLSSNFTIDPIVSCEPPWQYRNKMEFSFSSDSEGNPYLGLIIHGSRGKVLNLSECHLCAPWFIDAIEATRQWWEKSSLLAYHPYRNSGSLRTLTVREGQRSGDRMVMLTVSGDPDFALTKGDINDFVARLKEKISPQEKGKLSIYLRIQQIAKGRRTEFFEMLLDGPDTITEVLYISTHPETFPKKMVFKISPSAFFQPNTRQAELLYSNALQMAKIPHNGVVYDLYCGTGTLGICCAPFSKKVIGIEISPESVLDAKTNIADNQLTNVEIIEGSVQDKLKEFLKSSERLPPDLVMLDPPRVGLAPQAIEQVIALNPPKILYISCNPATQVEDVAQFLSRGYQIEGIRPVDQFPHTYHIENIVVLVRDQ